MVISDQKKAHEYVITRPDTPTPWINYIGSGSMVE